MPSLSPIGLPRNSNLNFRAVVPENVWSERVTGKPEFSRRYVRIADSTDTWISLARSCRVRERQLIYLNY